MADWLQPSLPAPYPNFLADLKARDFDAISLGVNTIITPQSGMMRYVRANNIFQEYDGATWNNKVLSVAGGGTGSSTPGGAGSALGLGSMAYQNANSVNITGGGIQGLGSFTVNGTSAFFGQINCYDIIGAHFIANNGINIPGGVLTVAGDASFGGTGYFGGLLTLQNNLNVGGRVDVNLGMAVYQAVLFNATLQVNGIATLAQVHVTSAGGCLIDFDLAVGRNAYVTGQLQAGNIYSNSTIYATTNIDAGGNITAIGQISTNSSINAGALGVTTNIHASGRIDADSEIKSLSAVRAVGDITAGANFGVSGVIYSGPSSVIITDANGYMKSQYVGYGWTGAGTKVLIDNNTWVDAKTIGGGGVVEIIHAQLNFPEGVVAVQYNIPWVNVPAHVGKYYAIFDTNGLSQETYKFEYNGPSIMTVRKLNQTLLTTNMFFTVIQHRTDV